MAPFNREASSDWTWEESLLTLQSGSEGMDVSLPPPGING